MYSQVVFLRLEGSLVLLNISSFIKKYSVLLKFQIYT